MGKLEMITGLGGCCFVTGSTAPLARVKTIKITDAVGASYQLRYLTRPPPVAYAHTMNATTPITLLVHASFRVFVKRVRYRGVQITQAAKIRANRNPGFRASAAIPFALM